MFCITNTELVSRLLIDSAIPSVITKLFTSFYKECVRHKIDKGFSIQDTTVYVQNDDKKHYNCIDNFS